MHYILVKDIFLLPAGTRYFKGSGIIPEFTEGLPRVYRIEGSNDLIDADMVEAPHNSDYFKPYLDESKITK